MKRIILIIGLFCLMVLPLQAGQQRILLSENFLGRFEEGGSRPATVLYYGNHYRYIKLFKKTCIINGVEYKLVTATVTRIGRVWHVNMIFIK
jgi:hypothetical protein